MGAVSGFPLQSFCFVSLSLSKAVLRKQKGFSLQSGLGPKSKN
jgi:hypothetical protein